MNTPLIVVALLALAALLIWFSVLKSMEDGFFNSLCTFAVTLAAFRCVDYEWRFLTHLIRSQIGITGEPSISLAYWSGFLMILLPGMLLSKFLSNPRVPFAPSWEKNGSLALGCGTGLILFTAILQSVIFFSAIRQNAMEAMTFFRLLFHMLGSSHWPS